MSDIMLSSRSFDTAGPEDLYLLRLQKQAFPVLLRDAAPGRPALTRRTLVRRVHPVKPKIRLLRESCAMFLNVARQAGPVFHFSRRINAFGPASKTPWRECSKNGRLAVASGGNVLYTALSARAALFAACLDGCVAQLVEQLTLNQRVHGSS
ncbi:MAG: hypothetical protein AAFY24_23925, partial [Pseudomonadota bacterium]